MKQIVRYALIVFCTVTVLLLLIFLVFNYKWGGKAVYEDAKIEQLNKFVIYRVDSIREEDTGFVVCFEDINEEAPTLNATYMIIPSDMHEGGTYRANWLRITAKMRAVQTYKDWIAMDFTGYVLTDETIERVKVETVDALVLLQEEHYKPYMQILCMLLWVIESFVLTFCVVIIVHKYLELREGSAVK